MNSKISLRALAAQILPPAHHLNVGNAAKTTAFRVGRSEISSVNEHHADSTVVQYGRANGSFC